MPKKLLHKRKERTLANTMLRDNLSLEGGKSIALENYGVRVSNQFLLRSLKRAGVHGEWKKGESVRRAARMLGNKNGQHPPTILLDRRELSEAIESGANKRSLMEHFGVSEFLLNRNLEHYGLRCLARRIDDTVYHVDADDGALSDLAPILGLDDLDSILMDENPTEEDFLKVRALQRALLSAAGVAQDVARRVRTRAKAAGTLTVTTNAGECAFEEAMLPVAARYGIGLGAQYKITDDEGSVFYDYHIPEWGVLVEVNGSSHGGKWAKFRDERKRGLAKREGMILFVADYKGKTFEGIMECVNKIIEYGTGK